MAVALLNTMEKKLKGGAFKMIEIKNPEQFFKEMSEVDNLLLNMMSGVLPEYLTEDEVELLIDEYGENWFEELGYSEPEYKKPNFKKESE
jgi:hypothetical protein